MAEQQVELSDKEKSLLEKAAAHLCMTLEDAANFLLTSAIAQRYKRGTGKPPAKVYPIKRNVGKDV